MLRRLRSVGDYIGQHGWRYTLLRAGQKLGERVLHTGDRAWRDAMPGAAELQRQRENPPDAGLISVIIPVYNTQPDLLDALGESLLAQTYPRWEACLYDGMSTREDTIRALDALAGRDRRFVVRHGAENLGIAGNTNLAAGMAQGQWLVLCDHDDVLSPEALWQVARAIEAEAPDMIYSDEDKITEDGRWHTDPHYKPDFCPDNLRSGNYICHLMAMRRTVLDRVGGLRSDFDGSQDHDLALRIAEVTDRILHVPHTLYHWRTVGSSMSHQHLERCLDAGARAVQEHMSRIGWPGRAEVAGGCIRLHYDVDEQATVRAIILGDDAAACRAALEKCRWSGLTVQCVASGTATRYADINAAARAATEDYLLVLDASCVPAGEGFIRELLMYAQRDDVGVVSPVMTDRRGRVTHAGFAVGMDGFARCRQQGIPLKSGGWHMQLRTSHNVAAVSAGCFMIRRDHFAPICEDWRSGLGAVDWCLALLKGGKRHVVTPHATAICENRRLLLLNEAPQEDIIRIHARWPGAKDPCYSDRYSNKRADYKIVRSTKKAVE